MSAQRQTGPAPTRERILARALKFFAVQGYAATTEAELLAALELDGTAFRLHFADTDHCFLAVYDWTIATAARRLIASMPRHGSWPQRLAAGFRTLLELIDANVAAARLVLVESQCAGEAALERYTTTLERLAPFMRGGRDCSAAPAHLPPILDSVLPAGVAFSLRHQLLRGDPARELYAELLRFLLLPYLGEIETEEWLTSPPRSTRADP